MPRDLSFHNSHLGRPALAASKSEVSGIRRGRRPLRTQPQSEPWMRSVSTGTVLRRKRGNGRSPSPNDESNVRGGSLTRSRNTQENVLVDVLPSFEMYNSLHRHIPQGNINPDCHDFPPCYQEIEAQQNSILRNTDQPTEIQALDSQNPQQRPDLRRSSSSGVNNLQAFSTQHLSIQNTQSILQESSEPIEDDFNDSDSINIDKLYSLPKLSTPIEVTIRLTKNPPKPHVRPEEESILKEYTSGDVIHGYCIVENMSSQPLPFEMFYVTLEGYTSLIDRQVGKRTLKRFLRMVDLSASWSYTNIQLSTGVSVVVGDVDYDNCVIGLTNNRILEPGVKYKKFFTFKLPNQLLDVTCKQEQFSHTLLPPTFGVDKFRNHGKYSGIRVNNILGCGHLGVKGSPILTIDMVDENLSINYTVDARIVGKDKRTQKLNLMKEADYNIRVIPFAFCCPIIGKLSTGQQLAQLKRDAEKRITALENVFSRLEANEPIQPRDVNATDIAGTVDNTSELDQTDLLRCKMDQLQLQRPRYVSSNSDDGGDSKAKFSDRDKVETQFSYKVRSKSASGLKNGIFSGLLGGSSSSSVKKEGTKEKTEKAGLILFQAKIPEYSLPYRPPSLLRKTNRFDNKNSYDQENWLQLLDLVPEEMRRPLDHLDIDLTCIQSNNSKPGEPPEIQSITTELVCITAKTDNSIPIKLNPELLMNQNKLNEVKRNYAAMSKTVSELSKRFEANAAKLNELYNMHDSTLAPRELRFSDFIPSQLQNNLESLANLEAKVVHLHDVFRKQTHTLKDFAPTQDTISAVPSNGSASQSNSGSFLSSTFSPSSEHSRSSTSLKFVDQIAHEWVKCEPLKYKRTVTVNLEYNDNIRETLVPTFESCLCARFYCIRVNIKFDHHAGTATIDIPVDIKSFHNI
ncbi:hypothetical protein ZYGR_0AD03440 [Zygosaccharomyces rouxii]|uniref:ZYRO0G14058p n=2 Tax=Zygosaccharomyces rouxii TaxID=4956 RepID=C5E0M6_ZYGRC|nr:uncharacterized protein ZYRO0G14058g [Zygosaccharomyces rouxii]KAH9202654.1 Bul1 N terminus-domain-containing protein [Zygosaccharomyces rouxii]GAV51161.1 hypothetical protein ZYGR_0AD03440 [Zygosaccharomyces rouxii]CAR29660.1 ZYRO0G14058p [Zygosaccharomyces rouxii]